MTGLPVMPLLHCENDVGGQFTLCPGSDSQGPARVSDYTATSYASVARPAVTGRTASAETGATPQAEGLVRARGRARFHTLTPPPGGRSRSNDPSREGHRAPMVAVTVRPLAISAPAGGVGGDAPPDRTLRRSAGHGEAGKACRSLTALVNAHSLQRPWQAQPGARECS